MSKIVASRPLSLRAMKITDDFWKSKMELVRKEVIPYQWEALNDRVEGAAPSFCMHNFKVAGKMNQKRRELGDAFEEPKFVYRGWEMLPKDPKNPDDHFYGWVFQDSDFSKWIEAVGYSLTQHPDPELEKIADEAIDIVCAAQQDDGYLDTYYIIGGRDKTFTNLKDNHELYCFGHLVEGAVAYYQATGKDKLLHAAMRFADYVDKCFGPQEGKSKGYPGHEIAEMALVRLFEATGDEKYLKLSRFFVDERGTKPYYFDQENPECIKKGQEKELRYAYNQAHLPVREQDEAFGHSVRAVYLYSGMADIARLTKDEALLKTCEKLWSNITNKKMYVTGGIGSTHMGEAFTQAYDLPNDTAYAETCAAIGLVFFARRMLEISPDSKYADVMERALYNGVLSGMALDGKSFFYVNPLEVNPEACHKDERKFHVKPVRQKWFGCACCPPNIARLLSSIGSYAYTENEDTLFLHLYMGSSLTKKIGNQQVDICVESNFPWDGKVKIRVRAKGTGLKLALRIPGWCNSYEFTGFCNADMEEKQGYLYIQKDWGEEDCLELNFPMDVRLIAANPLVRENVGKVAVMRGPVVYCLEAVDNGENLHLVTLSSEQEKVEVTDMDICGVTAKALTLSGWRKDCSGEQNLYHVWEKEKKSKVRLKYIPYYMWANRTENEMQVWTIVE